MRIVKRLLVTRQLTWMVTGSPVRQLAKTPTAMTPTRMCILERLKSAVTMWMRIAPMVLLNVPRTIVKTAMETVTVLARTVSEEDYLEIPTQV